MSVHHCLLFFSKPFSSILGSEILNLGVGSEIHNLGVHIAQFRVLRCYHVAWIASKPNGRNRVAQAFKFGPRCCAVLCCTVQAEQQLAERIEAQAQRQAKLEMEALEAAMAAAPPPPQAHTLLLPSQQIAHAMLINNMYTTLVALSNAASNPRFLSSCLPSLHLPLSYAAITCGGGGAEGASCEQPQVLRSPFELDAL